MSAGDWPDGVRNEGVKRGRSRQHPQSDADDHPPKTKAQGDGEQQPVERGPAVARNLRKSKVKFPRACGYVRFSARLAHGRHPMIAVTKIRRGQRAKVLRGRDIWMRIHQAASLGRVIPNMARVTWPPVTRSIVSSVARSGLPVPCTSRLTVGVDLPISCPNASCERPRAFRYSAKDVIGVSASGGLVASSIATHYFTS